MVTGADSRVSSLCGLLHCRDKLSSFLQVKIREVLTDVRGGIPEERMSYLSLNLSSFTAGIVLSAFSFEFSISMSPHDFSDFGV